MPIIMEAGEHIGEGPRVHSSTESNAPQPTKRRYKQKEPRYVPPIRNAAGKVQLTVHKMFDSHKHFKECWIYYVIENFFEYKKVKSAKNRPTYSCKVELLEKQ